MVEAVYMILCKYEGVGRIYECTCPPMLLCPHKVHMSYQHFLPTPLALRVFHFTVKYSINLLQVIDQTKSHYFVEIVYSLVQIACIQLYK